MDWIRTITLIIILNVSGTVFGQDCLPNLEEAQQAYFNGNFGRVEPLLVQCYLGLKDSDKTNALRLLINAALLEREKTKAENYMKELLIHDPLFDSRSTDIAEFKSLLQSYEIRTKYHLGIVAGVNAPSYDIMQYQSLGSETLEPDKYDGTLGLSIGATIDWSVTKNIFLTTSVLYQSHHYKQSEVILSYQRVSIDEKLTFLSFPTGVKYIGSFRGFQPVLSAGITPSRLLGSKGDIALTPLQSGTLSGFIGVPEETINRDISSQRTNWLLSYFVNAAIRKKMGLTSFEFGISYEYGLNNLVSSENRFTDRELFETFSYVPDDFKMNHLRFTLGVFKSFTFPIKK